MGVIDVLLHTRSAAPAARDRRPLGRHAARGSTSSSRASVRSSARARTSRTCSTTGSSCWSSRKASRASASRSTQRYRLQRFHVGFVEQALRARAPIVPMAFIGSDDQAPILYDVKPLARRLGLPVAADHADLPVARAARPAALPRPLPDRLRRAAALPRALRARGRRRRAPRALPRQPGAPRRAAAGRSEPLMSNVLVTHADEPIGRRIVKLLFHDERVGAIFAVGDGPPPRAFDRFLAGGEPRLRYARVDLAQHRPVADLFHSTRVARERDRHRRARAAPRRAGRRAGADRRRPRRAHRRDAARAAALPRDARACAASSRSAAPSSTGCAPGNVEPARRGQRARPRSRRPAGDPLLDRLRHDPARRGAQRPPARGAAARADGRRRRAATST